VSARYIKPGWFRKTVLDKTVSAFTRLGVSVWGSRLLRVRGRKSGEWRSTPVNVVTYQANRYLVSPRGHTQWVRNIRASKEGELVLGGRAERFRAVEISDEEKLPILREYLRRWKFEVGMFFNGVGPDSPESELRRIAPDHPVVRVDPATDSFS
jgi:deazaflavin-dependent oxidoreductase (nitroreductase family)